jgi:class 3 adenylate cyclase/DNA-binding SARP family transcriptional activator
VPSPRYRLTLLGRFDLTGPDGPVELPNKKLAGLLAHLACTAPAPQSREKLATLLWGSHFETQAQQNLRQALYRLRQTLGQDVLVSDGGDIALTPGVIDCDATRFQALIREGGRASLADAVDLYKERLLSDVNISEEAWAHWLAGERQRLEGLALDALVRFGEIELGADRANKAIETAHRALAINNLREDAHRLIIQALAAAGRKAEALRHYQNLIALLERELNTQPDAATKLLVSDLGNAPSRSPVAKIALAQPDQPSNAMPALVNTKANGEHDINAESPLVAGDRTLPAGVVDPGRPERRQVTIMVSTTVSSTPLSAGRDPEDMRDQIGSFHKMVADVVARFDGFIAQYLSDGVVVYFGYPVAHEHDAEQAVRAAVAILDADRSLKASSDAPARARIGIATGLVVVGEQRGSGDTRQRVAIGETPNLAAQLLAVAAPGEVVVAAGTRRLVGRMFECRALAADERKGLPQSVEAWQVRGEAAGVSRFEARRRGAPTPFVGRQEEMDLLLRRWDQAKAGEGRVVLLSGEPGIGKSRIAEGLLARIEGEPHARLRYFCSPHHTHSPLHPIIAQLGQAAGFEPDGSPSAKLDKLMSLLEPTSTNLSRDVALVAELLAVPADERYPALAVSPQQKREMTLMALLDQLDGAAARTPVLIVFEDVHWIDPTSLDLLDRAIARIANLRVLLVVTFRPDFQPTWVGLPHVTTLPLSRLGRRDSASIISGITRGKALPNAVVERILSHSDGVALFIEELTNMLLESGPLRETTESYVLDGSLPPLAIPTTLQASLVARLDRLGAGKDVGLIGAAIGREFSHELIAAVSAMAAINLDAALERLTASGLVSRRGTPPDATYSFKHALVQDAAYATMLKSERRQLHSSIAKVLVERFPALAQNQPEVVAHHFSEAGAASEAIGYWRRAAQLASARSAMHEAVSSFERALALLEALPETRERQEAAIDLRCDLSNALFALGKFELRFLRAAAGLAEALDDRRRLGQASVYLCRNAFMAGHLREAREFGERALALAQSLGDVSLEGTASLYFGAACFHLGDYSRAEDLLLKVLQWLEGDRRRERFGLAGFPAVFALGFLGWLLADRGKFEQAVAHGEEGLRLAEALDNVYSQVFALWMLGRVHNIRGDSSSAIRLHERGLALSRESKLTLYSLHHMGSLGYAYALSGRAADGIQMLQDALTAIDAMQYGLADVILLEDLGETYVAADQLADARDVAGRVLALARERGQPAYEARALRLLGEVTVGRSDPAKAAEGHLRDALARAEKLGMRPLVARCHLGLGKLARRTRKRRDAQDHLTTAATMCREMGMRFWLEQAEAEMRQDDLR